MTHATLATLDRQVRDVPARTVTSGSDRRRRSARAGTPSSRGGGLPRFVLDDTHVARRPPEARGLARDEVRLLVARPGAVEHTRFRSLPEQLAPGDVVVVNTSATRPAAVDGTRADGRATVVHVGSVRDGWWVVELRRPDGSGPQLDGRRDERVDLLGGPGLVLDGPATPGGPAPGVRLWRARPVGPAAADPTSWLERHGRAVTYGYLEGRYPLADHQTVFARHPGSAEMPSAGRPFTTGLVTALVTAGVEVVPVLLHTGLSSPEVHEPPQPEQYEVTEGAVRRIEAARRAGGRVVAVGTTVVRALETVAAPDGRLHAGSGWTDLVLGRGRPARVVDGLVTGWHEPEASHLQLLESVAGTALVRAAYDAALAHGGYLWHEFGDSCLLLP